MKSIKNNQAQLNFLKITKVKHYRPPGGYNTLYFLEDDQLNGNFYSYLQIKITKSTCLKQRRQFAIKSKKFGINSYGILRILKRDKSCF